MNEYVVGAYPSSPAHRNWDPVVEAELFSLLSNDSRVGSLELPWTGHIHPHDINWIHSHFPQNLNALITTIPFVMGQLGKNSQYGIASTHEDGRKLAVGHLREVLAAVNEFHEKAGRKVVSLVEIHSAPRQIGTSSQLTKSLEEITSWNWQDVALAIEHCDAFISEQTPEKGFLSLHDEIKAIQNSGCDVGIFINWGRSAIEFRDAGRVLEHIEGARAANLLRGMIFSGASSFEGNFGYPWIDAHLPFKKSASHPFGESNSLLTEDLAHRAMTAAGDLQWLGIKMGWPSNVPGTVEERYQMLSAAMDVLDS